MKKRSSPCAAFACFLAALLIVPPAAAQSMEQQARSILKATDVRGDLVAHLGCGDGRLTAALHASDSFVVHGLDTDAANMEKARTHIQSLNLYGPVSADRLEGNELPYIDNLVNIIVTEDLGQVPMSEVMRVLAPNGLAVGADGLVVCWIKDAQKRQRSRADVYWIVDTGGRTAQQ